jgi:hypothetical protein
VRVDRFLWACVILAILLLCGYELAHCQIVPASEMRLTAGTPYTVPGRYQIMINSATGRITCTTPTGTDCSPTAGSIAWGAITGVPTTFPPSAHTHNAGDINGGILGPLYGGTGFNGAPADIILVGNGTTYDQRSLCTGYVKYSLTTHLLTCDAGTGGSFTGGTLSTKLTLAPSTLTGAGLNLGTGSVTPTSGLATGDLWGDAAWELNWWDGANQRTAERRDHKGQPNGYAPLDSGGLVPVGNLPAGSTGVNVTGNAQQYAGFCTGTASSSATLSIPPFGTANASSCSSTTTANELPMSWSGTLRNLQVKAGSAGRLSTSGVVTLYKNGVATGITCTIGTGTICSDVTHTSTVNVGDTVGIRMTTQSTETLANVRVTFEDYGGGTGFNYRGAWTASTIYNPYDIVSYNGTTYERSGPTFTSAGTFNAANWNVWAAGATGGIPIGGTTGQVLAKNSATDYDVGWVTGGGGGGSGTVTSVALSAPAQFTVSGSPVTTSGTLALTWATQAANIVFAGPTSGGAATPGFRALVAADIPTLNQSTTGNAATATALAADGTDCSVGNYARGVDASGNAQGCTVAGGGGTVTSFSAGNLSPLFTTSVATATTTPALTFTLSNATAHTFYGNNTGSTGAPAFVAITAADVPTLNQNTTGTAAALAANGTNCTANQFNKGVDASGNAESCAALVSGDIPNNAANTTGTSANVTGTVAIGNGGTGQTTKTPAFNALAPHTTLGDLAYHDGTNVVRLAGNTVATRKFLRQLGTGAVSAVPAWDTIVAGDIPTLNQSTTGNAATATALAANGTNCTGGNFPLGVDASGNAETCTAAYSNPLTTLGDILYENATPAPARLAGNTSATKQYLQQTGTGTISAAPVWGAIAAGDVPTLNQSTTGNAATATALAANGTNCSAGSVGAGVDASGNEEGCTATVNPTAHNLLSTAHGDTTAATVSRGAIITGQTATPKWQLLAAGSASQCLQMDASGVDIVWGACATGGSGSPGGATTQVQFNDAGAFGGDTGLTWDKTNDILTVGPAVTNYQTWAWATQTAARTVTWPDSVGPGIPHMDASGNVTYKGRGGYLYAENYCTTPGTYDGSCVNNAIAAAQTAGGGTVDATAIQNMTSTTEIGVGASGASHFAVTLILPSQGAWKFNITDTTKCGIRVYDLATLFGWGTGVGGGFTLQPFQASNTMEALLCTDASPIGNGSYVKISGVSTYNMIPATMSKGQIHIYKLFDSAQLNDVLVQTNQTSSYGYLVEGACCGAGFNHIVANTYSAASTIPIAIIDIASFSTANTACLNCSFDHPGAGQPAIKLDQSAGSINVNGSWNFYNLQIESNQTTDTATALVQVISGYMVLDGYRFFHLLNTSTAYAFDVSGTNSILNARGGQYKSNDNTNVNAINNHISGQLVVTDSGTNGNIPDYTPTLAYRNGIVINQVGAGGMPNNPAGNNGTCNWGNTATVIGTNDLLWQCSPLGTTGWTHIEDLGPMGTSVGTYGTHPVIITPNRTETVRFLAAGGVQRPDNSAITAASAAINTTETVITKTAAVQANRLQAGTVIRVTWIGTCTSTAANISTFALRWGTAGTTADALLASAPTAAAATSGTTIPFRAVMEVTIRTTGASATAYGTLSVENAGATGIATVTQQFIVATMTAINSTTANAILSATYKSAATTTTSTFQEAFIEVVTK